MVKKKKNKIEIEYLKKKIKGGWIGLNYPASKSLHLPYHHKHPLTTIEVFEKVPRKVRLDTIHHEEAELFFMHNLGWTYPHAHKVALRFEKKNKPFPKKKVLQKLKQMEFKWQ